MLGFNLLFIQFIGVLAAAGDVYATTHKNDRHFMVIIAISSLFWGVHYAFLGAWAAVGSDLLTSVRYLGALYFKKNSIACAFMFFYVAAIPFTYETPIDILPYFSGFISTYALFFFHGVKMRLVFILSHIFWVTYAFTEGSIPGVVLNIIMMVSHVRTIIKIKNST